MVRFSYGVLQNQQELQILPFSDEKGNVKRDINLFGVALANRMPRDGFTIPIGCRLFSFWMPVLALRI